jgi:two-component system response regulator LytT
MSLSVLIVEDEAIIADDIAITLEQNGYMVAGIADSFDKAIALISSTQPDILLLDIIIKGSKTGLDLAQEVNTKYQIPFLFLTSLFDQKTVIKANELSPVGYVVKPFKEADLIVGLQMGWKKHKISKQNQKKEDPSIFIRKEGSLVPLSAEEIYYAEGSDNYTYLHTREHKHVITQTLKSIEAQLKPVNFVRIHKSFLVNIKKIDVIEHSVVFVLGNPLPIGKVYKKALMDSLTIW